jgi:hypothetical protein
MNAICDIWTEGKTDWQHIKRAFALLGEPAHFSFQENLPDGPSRNLFAQLTSRNCSHLVLIMCG